MTPEEAATCKSFLQLLATSTPKPQPIPTAAEPVESVLAAPDASPALAPAAEEAPIEDTPAQTKSSEAIQHWETDQLQSFYLQVCPLFVRTYECINEGECVRIWVCTADTLCFLRILSRVCMPSKARLVARVSLQL